jgi:hypothetical protein
LADAAPAAAVIRATYAVPEFAFLEGELVMKKQHLFRNALNSCPLLKEEQTTAWRLSKSANDPERKSRALANGRAVVKSFFCPGLIPPI